MTLQVTVLNSRNFGARPLFYYIVAATTATKIAVATTGQQPFILRSCSSIVVVARLLSNQREYAGKRTLETKPRRPKNSFQLVSRVHKLAHKRLQNLVCSTIKICKFGNPNEFVMQQKYEVEVDGPHNLFLYSFFRAMHCRVNDAFSCGKIKTFIVTHFLDFLRENSNLLTPFPLLKILL